MAFFSRHSCVIVLLCTNLVCWAGPTVAQERNPQVVNERVVNSRCDYAIEMALNDPDVIAVVIERIRSHRMVLSDIYCLPWFDADGLHYVYFDFDCAPELQCFWDPGMLVAVDVRRGLVKIVDEWYVLGDIPPQREPSVLPWKRPGFDN